MIVFKTLEWCNFLSTGNAANKIIFNKSPSTLVIGRNGEGKSTLLDALTFSLFGKPFRNINKPQLINSINGKNCAVEITFDIGQNEYKVIRGMKPNVFEIWLNGSLINQDAAVKDYQNFLEQQILRLNYKTFTQVVILGSASFVPFMQLPPGQRREVIEDILDIGVFSIMNSILKERMNENKDQLVAIDNKITIAKNNVEVQKKLIGTLVNSKRDQVAQIRKQIEDNEAEIAANETRWNELNAEINKLLSSIEEDNVDQLINASIKAKNKFVLLKEQTEKNLSFFKNNETCPSCAQGIAHDHKETIVNKLIEDTSEIDSNITTIEEAYKKLLEKQKKVEQVNKEILALNIQCNNIVSSNKTLNNQNQKLLTDIESTKKDTTDLDAEKKKLK